MNKRRRNKRNKVDTRIEKLFEFVERLGREIDKLLESQRETDKMIEKLRERQERTDEMIEKLRERQERTDEMIEKLRERQERTDEMIEKLRERQERTDEMIEKLRERQERTDEMIEKLRERQERTDEQLRKTDEQLRKTDEQMKKTDEQLRKTDIKIDRLAEQVGKITDSWGSFTEGLVAPSVHKFLVSKGFKNVVVGTNVYLAKDGQSIEYDIVGETEEFILIVSVKTTVRMRDIQELILSAKKFYYFSDKHEKEIRVAIAGIKIPANIEKFALRKGILLFKVSGDLMVPVEPRRYMKIKTK